MSILIIVRLISVRISFGWFVLEEEPSVKAGLMIDYHDQHLQYMESVIRADDDDNDDDDKGDKAGDQNLEHLKSVLEAGRWWHKT